MSKRPYPTWSAETSEESEGHGKFIINAPSISCFIQRLCRNTVYSKKMANITSSPNLKAKRLTPSPLRVTLFHSPPPPAVAPKPGGRLYRTCCLPGGRRQWSGWHEGRQQGPAELARRTWRGQQTRGSFTAAVPHVWHKDAQRTSQDYWHEPNMTHVRPSCHHAAHSLLSTFVWSFASFCFQLVSAVYPNVIRCNTFLMSRHSTIYHFPSENWIANSPHSDLNRPSYKLPKNTKITAQAPPKKNTTCGKMWIQPTMSP